MFSLHAHGQMLALTKPLVMGILNTTPDSFSDGGEFACLEQACRQADQMVRDGVDIIDVGGESTRPGAAFVPIEEELKRVLPVIDYIRQTHPQVWISIDTYKAEVMTAAVHAGAHLINDVKALQSEGALAAAAALDVPICLMHMQGSPKTMQDAPTYHNVLDSVAQFFEARIQACLAAGIARERLLLDVGFGFGKTLEHNYQLLANLSRFHQFQLPLLIGLSRKSMLGDLLQREPKQRLAGSLAGALSAIEQGAQIIRVHDVAETVDVIKVFQMIAQYKQEL